MAINQEERAALERMFMRLKDAAADKVNYGSITFERFFDGLEHNLHAAIEDHYEANKKTGRGMVM